LIFERRGAGAVNEAYMGESNNRRFDADELLPIRCGRLREATDECGEQ
jgi:hypothetical protein